MGHVQLKTTWGCSQVNVLQQW